MSALQRLRKLIFIAHLNCTKELWKNARAQRFHLGPYRSTVDGEKQSARRCSHLHDAQTNKLSLSAEPV